MTKEEIEKRVRNGATGEFSHCIIICDHWDYTYSSRYIEKEENIYEIIENIKRCGSPGMITIPEIYNYNLDIEKQLNESRAYHIEPLQNTNKKKEDSWKNNKNIEKAIQYAEKMHKGQTRKNQEPYINHPLRVAENVIKFKKSKNQETLIISAILHDTIEDTSATYYDIVNLFGPQVANLVLELTTEEDLKRIVGKEKYLSIKMKNMSSWALTIKLCDRLDNVNDLEKSQDDKFIKKYIKETDGILKCLLTERELSKTHLTIIEQILSTLKKITPQEDKKEQIRITELIELYSSRINNYQKIKK